MRSYIELQHPLIIRTICPSYFDFRGSSLAHICIAWLVQSFWLNVQPPLLKYKKLTKSFYWQLWISKFRYHNTTTQPTANPCAVAKYLVTKNAKVVNPQCTSIIQYQYQFVKRPKTPLIMFRFRLSLPMYLF